MEQLSPSLEFKNDDPCAVSMQHILDFSLGLEVSSKCHTDLSVVRVKMQVPTVQAKFCSIFTKIAYNINHHFQISGHGW